MAEIATMGNISANESLVIAAITNGTYFTYNEVPSGTIDGANATFTLAGTPNPVGSLELRLNGQILQAGGNDYTLSGSTITMVNAPFVNDVLLATYVVSPV